MKDNSPTSKKITNWKKNFGDARNAINEARQTIGQTLNDIDASMISGDVNIEDHIVDTSIWTDIGGFFFTRGMPSDAELLYNRMLTTIAKTEEKLGKHLHKGMAFYNLGISQINQKNFDEGVPNVLAALEEDVKRVGQTEAHSLLAHGLKDGLLIFISSYIDTHFLKELVAETNDKTLQHLSSVDLLKVLDEPEQFFVCKVINTKTVAKFRTDIYSRVVLFDNLRNATLLSEIVLKKAGTKPTLGGLVPEVFSKFSEKWVDVFRRNIKLTRFDDDSSGKPPIVQFQNNLKAMMAVTFDSSPETDYLTRTFLCTVLLRNYTSHFFDEYKPLFADSKLYEWCFQRSMQALLYSLRGSLVSP